MKGKIAPADRPAREPAPAIEAGLAGSIRPSGVRTCFFAHYNEHGRLAQHVYGYVAALAELDFAIVFISTSSLEEADRRRLESLSITVEEIPNGGLDFGAWSYALDKYGPTLNGDLLLANDSVYGPLAPLDGIFSRFAESNSDFFGLVESFEVAPHLQSWFLYLRPHVYRSTAFHDIFHQPFSTMSKRHVIRRGEIRLSQALRRAGFTYMSLFSPRQVIGTPRLFLTNPTVLLWQSLPERFGIPFVKVQALRDDPYFADVSTAWMSAIQRIAPSKAAEIEQHLSESTSRRPQRGWLFQKVHRLTNPGMVAAIEYAHDTGVRVGLARVIAFSAVRRTALALDRLRKELASRVQSTAAPRK